MRDRRVDGVDYAELHAHSGFSFLDGASDPEELAAEAHRLGLAALALTDHHGLYGVVRFAEAARALGLPTVFGAEVALAPAGPRTGEPDPAGAHLVLLARDPEGYARLSAALAGAHLAGGEKGKPVFTLDELAGAHGGHWVVLTGCRKGPVPAALVGSGPSAARRELDRLAEAFGRQSLAVELWDHGDPLDTARNDALALLAARAGVLAVATNNVHYATPSSYRLATTLSAVRARRPLAELEGWLPPAPTACLRSGREQARRFARWPGVVEQAAEVGRACAFDLRLVAPRLPDFPVPDGYDEQRFLCELACRGALERYGPRQAERVPGAWAQIDHELSVIGTLGYAGYFLVVWDIAQFCRRQGIYCQGRGSAANSAVCYALGITNVDAVALGLLFERFLSPARDGPPDIDVDIESGRREEVIQYVYDRYGRRHAAQVSNVITYRPRSAIRDVAKALGYPAEEVDRWAAGVERGHHRGSDAAAVVASEPLPAAESPHAGPLLPAAESPHAGPAPSTAGLLATADAPAAGGGGAEQGDAPASGLPPLVAELATEVLERPRHLGIHSAGMVLCDRPVVEVCPVEWGRMPGRTVLQWDKDDCAAIGLVKFDLLGLGMLEALHRTVDLVAEHHGVVVDLGRLPQEPEVYELLCRADTVGVFQVESRAQMGTLPRVQPRTFYDLVVEVALIRPGPIQGQAVNPYIRRRRGLEPVTYLHPLLEPILERTLGVPLFQEQLMEMAVAVAGFSAAEADELRQAMAAKRSAARMARLRHRLYEGMRARGVTGDAADAIYRALAAFANFGFPESHSVSFAHLVYSSSWLKLHYPAAFFAGLLNSQPMGFWSPQSLVADAKRHGVEVRRPHVDRSLPTASLEGEGGPDDRPALRLGLAAVKGVGEATAERIAAGRPWAGPEDLVRRAGVTRAQLEALAAAGALDHLQVPPAPAGRRRLLWAAGAAAQGTPDRLPGIVTGTDAPPLPEPTPLDTVGDDLWALGLAPERTAMELARPELAQLGVVPASGLGACPHGRRVAVAGVVTHRQHPETAGGAVFVNLEDETGHVNVVFSRGAWARWRHVARHAPVLLVRGRLEAGQGVVNVTAEHVEELEVGAPVPASRDFR
ncbi:MAG TPA: DNA polymerase III subunit alpha [Acidimicrobiales bacterium]|nr:DNA polymerase III subunit alpha [Acidimicrobiales bacterium]